MDEPYRFTYSRYMEAIGERTWQRLYPWILFGLTILYIVLFQWLSPMGIAVLTILAGWFFYRRGALIASALAIVINLILVQAGGYELQGEGPRITNTFLIGHLFSFLAATTVGFFREELERYHRVYRQVRVSERHLILINMATKEILEGGRLDEIYYRLLMHLTNLVTADQACLLVWDETTQTFSLAATTYPTDESPSHQHLQPDETSHAFAVLAGRHVEFLDDAQGSSQLANICSSKNRGASVRSAILIPLATHDYRFGLVVLAFATPQQFDRESISYIELTSQQITLALRSIQQERQIDAQLRVDRALISIGRALSASERTGTGEVLQLIVSSARELMPHAEKSVIHLLDEEEQILFARAVSGFDDQEREHQRVGMRVGEGIAGQVMNEGVTINIGDIQSHPGFLLTQPNPSFRSLLVAPVQSGTQHLGTISVQSSRQYAFTRNDEEVLKALAIQAAVALENSRLFEITQKSLKEVNILYQFSRALAISLDTDQLFRDMIDLLEQIFDYHYAQIYLLDPDTQNLVLKIGSGQIGKQLVKTGFTSPAGEGIVGHVAATGQPFVTNNVDEVVFFRRNPLLPNVQYEIAVPITIDDNVIGVLDIQQEPPHRLSDDDLQLMIAIADQLALVLQKANLYSTLQTALQQEQMVRSQLIQSERLALVGRLLASVSHELNNPLQAIQNALFLLREEKNLSLQGRQDLDVILAEAERMAALIERLRSAYRPVRRQDFQAIDLNNLIEDVHALISTHMRHKMIAFEFIPDPELAHASGLPDQIRQVTLNLFMNAIEVMQPGGRLTVQTHNLPEPGEILFTVKDTGPGIDLEILPRIFDAFITSKHTGTGLGLTITRDIIQQHHGRITAENAAEGGAAFCVWLPVHPGGVS